MKHGLKGLCGAGALVLPLSVWAAPVVEDLSAQNSFYQQAQVRESSGGSLALFNQLQENQRQIKELRGQIEELRYQLDQQRQLAQQRFLDLEQRIQASGVGSGVQAPDTGVDTDAATAVASDGEDGRQAYQAAFAKVQARDFDAAIAAFEAFVSDYPQSSLRPNGYYWLGELYSARSELEPAAQAFTTVIEDYPQSNKVPDALYKLGLLRARQGQPDASKQLLERVQAEHPDSRAADMASDFLNQSGL